MNDHHWQHRQNDEDKELDTETKLACLENVMDWLARGYQFKNRPYQYYENHKDGITLPSKQKEFIEYLIYEGIDKRIGIFRACQSGSRVYEIIFWKTVFTDRCT